MRALIRRKYVAGYHRRGAGFRPAYRRSPSCPRAGQTILVQLARTAHVDLYDKDEHVAPAVAKLAAFYAAVLGGSTGVRATT